MNGRLKMSLVLTLSLLVIAALAALGWAWSLWTGSGPSEGPELEARVRIPAGAGPAAIADTLVARGLLDHPRIFLLGCRVQGLDRRLKAGRYALPYGSSPRDLARLLVAGRSELLRVTVPEGLGVREVAARLGGTFSWSQSEFLDAAEQEVATAMARRGWLPAGSSVSTLRDRLEGESQFRTHSIAEGYLFPETYLWDEGISASGAARELVGACLDTLATVLGERSVDDRSASLTPHEIMVLASIVEAETPRTDEMPMVAAVYLNRLVEGRLLEADPTVAHALGKKGQRILYRDLDVDSEYNTCRSPGWPPGPIGVPGGAAIRSVLRPAHDREVSYFVADGEGGHVFSRTWEEHEAAVREYRKRRSSRAGS